MEQVQLLKFGKAAAILDTTEGSLREALASGRIVLPVVRVGRRGVRIAMSDLEAYIALNRRPGGEPAAERS